MSGSNKMKLFLLYLMLAFGAIWSRIKPRPKGWR